MGCQSRARQGLHVSYMCNLYIGVWESFSHFWLVKHESLFNIVWHAGKSTELWNQKTRSHLSCLTSAEQVSSAICNMV